MVSIRCGILFVAIALGPFSLAEQVQASEWAPETCKHLKEIKTFINKQHPGSGASKWAYSVDKYYEGIQLIPVLAYLGAKCGVDVDAEYASAVAATNQFGLKQRGPAGPSQSKTMNCVTVQLSGGIS